MATILRCNIDGTDLVQDGSAPLLLWLPRFPLKLVWNRTQVSAIKDQRLADMGPSLCWTVYLWPDKQHSVCAKGPVCQCLSTELQVVPATGDCCCLQDAAPWHVTTFWCSSAVCVTHHASIASLSVMYNMGWAVKNVMFIACDLVCDECHMWRMLPGLWRVSHVTYVILVCDECHMWRTWSWYVTNVTCNACDLVCDECHVYRMWFGLWRVSHVTHVT
jgi:hypothetical protein